MHQGCTVTDSKGRGSVSIGRYITLVREAAGYETQAALAEELPFSAPTLSRIESGEKALTEDELTSIVKVLKRHTPRAQALMDYWSQSWDMVERPRFDHPNLGALWEINTALKKLQSLREKKDIKGVFLRQVDLYDRELRRIHEFLRSTEHQVAVIGRIGVGKTTAICKLVGLLKAGVDKLEKAVVLETGSGGITLCEVHIARGPNFGLRIVPRTEDSIRKDVEELAEYLVRLVRNEAPQPESVDDEDGDGDGLGISREVVRAIRNMSGLTESRREEGGRKVRVDPAKQLAAQYADHRELAIQIMTRMNLLRRQQRDAWFPADGRDPQAWLEETFSGVNNGRHPGFTLPAKIEVVVPDAVLDTEELSIKIVDTKGIDQTAERQDLECHFDDPRTLVVLCTHFNDAPDLASQTLLKRAREANAKDLETKTILLTLPHPGQALAMKHDGGGRVEDDQEGYELKKDQIDLRLRGLGLGKLQVVFFNAKEEPAEAVRKRLVELITEYRLHYCKQVTELVAAVNALERNEKSVTLRLVFEQVGQRLATWIDKNGQLAWEDTGIHDDLIEAIDGTRYASTVRAAVRRFGEWDNLDYYHHLAFGTRRLAVQVIGNKVRDFKVIVQNLVDDEDLSAAGPFLGTVLESLDATVDGAYRTISIAGREAFYTTLQSEYAFWGECERRWGAGKGYKVAIRDMTAAQFRERCENARAMVRTMIENQWREVVGVLNSMLKEQDEKGA